MRTRENFDSSNFVVSSLPAYVQENRDLLLKNFALVGTETRRRVSLQTGVKGKEYLNFLALAPVLQDGSACGFSASGTATLSQRTVETAIIKVNMDVCPKSLIGKYAEYLVRITASAEELPFEQYIMDGLIAEINRKIEKLIWQGDKTQTTDTDLKWINGWIAQFSADTSVIDVSIASGSSAYAGILATYMAMPDEALERGGVIFVSPAIYKAFLQDMVALNYFHYAGPQASAPDEFYLPGTDVRVIKTPGLAGNLNIVGTWEKNLVYACDIEGATEDIKVWFSNDDDVVKIKVEWNSGVSYYFPDQVVLGTFAATPVAVAGVNAALASIAESNDAIADVLGDVHDDTNHAITTKAAA